MADAALLEVSALTVAYGTCVAVEEVSLFVNEGEFIGVCGPNKAGKSSVCGAIAGILPVAGGSIRFRGREISSAPTHERLQLGLALCPEGRGIYPSLSVLENLRVAAGGLSRVERDRRIADALDVFTRLGERLTQTAGTLSGGEAQMLGVARRLVNRPSLLIVDEPSLGLAPKAIGLVSSSLARLRRELGTAIVVVEEGLPRLPSEVDRAYLMNMRTIVASGTTSELAGRAVLRSVFAGEAPIPAQ